MARDFYDELVPFYHLIFDDWNASIDRLGRCPPQKDSRSWTRGPWGKRLVLARTRRRYALSREDPGSYSFCASIPIMTKNIEGLPQSERRLQQDLAALGVTREMTLMVHSSLSSIGWVIGGPPTVVRALLHVLGENGTLAMPAATPHCADPATWTDPKVPEEWLDDMREHIPVFDPQTTPTTMGAIPEAFRTWPGTLRSRHPLESVCARGRAASDVTSEHPLAFSEGRGGPFEKLYDLESWILLIGVGFNRCTALHFAESLVETRRVTTVRFPTLDDGRRVWNEVPNVADDNDTHFPVIGEKYVAARKARHGHIGEAPSTLVPMRDLVDFAVGYFEEVL